MTLSLTERDRRWTGLQRAMQAAGLDVVIACMTDARGQKGAFRFLSDERPFHRFGYVVMPARGEPVLVLHPVLAHAPRGLWVGDVRTPADAGAGLVAIVQALGGGRVGLIGADQGMRLGDHAALAAHFALTGADALFETVRAIKSAEEIAGLEAASAIADACFAALLDAARPDWSERRLCALLSERALAAGADELLFLTMSPEPERTGFRSLIRAPADVDLGARGSFIFSIELSGPDGFWVELARIVSFANGGGTAQPIADLCHASVASGLDCLTASLAWDGRAEGGAIQAALEAPFDPAAYEVAPASGHAIGQDVIEQPIIGRSAVPGTALRDRMAFAMHPMAHHRHRPEIGYVADTYAIAGGMPRRLSRWPHEHFSLAR